MRLISLYAGVSDAYSAIMRSVDSPTLFQQVCQIMVQQGGIQLAWIGMLEEHGRYLTLTESAGVGVPRSLPWLLDSETSLDARLALEAVRGNRSAICNYLQQEHDVLSWQSVLPSDVFHAVAFLPIHQHRQVIGTLGLYVTEEAYFDDASIELLLKMTTNISLALDGFAHEAKRRAGALAIHESEARYRRLFETSPEAMFIDQRGKFVQVNNACVRLFKVKDAKALIGQPVIKFLHPNHHEQYKHQPETALEEGMARAFEEKQYLHGDGSVFDVEVAATAINYQGGQASEVVIRDITDRKSLERVLRILAESTALSQGDEFFQQLVRHLASALQVRYAVVAECLNEKLTEAHILAFWKDGDWLPGYDYEIANTPCQTLLEGKDNVCYFPDNEQAYFPTNHPLAELGAVCYLGMALKEGDKAIGHIFIMHDQPLLNVQQAKSILSIFAARASTELTRKRIDDHISYIAHHDALTGLANRELLLDRIERAIAHARRHEGELAVLFLDLDRFKNINDTLGHQAGDICLKEIANRLNTILRETDTVARFDSDEFMMLMQDYVGPSYIGEVAQRILETISEPFLIEGQEISLTASLGIAIYPGDSDTTEGLIKTADVAMYRAKDIGRNNYQFYSALANVHTLEHLTLESALRHAILEQQLELHFQPKVNLASGNIVGAEALVRWRHPEHGLLGPDKFIPLAEETGLIVKLGEWVIEQACIQAVGWPQRGHGICVAVNLSARQFAYDGLLPFIDRVLNETGLNPHCLEFEITESVLMHNPALSVQIMQKLRDLGVRISLDDFGTGYSSLAYLKKFPIDTIKIDRSFIRDIPSDPDDAAITRAIISMARSMNKSVIAEGVESREQLEFLQGLQCDEFQGYYFSVPLPNEAFISLLDAPGLPSSI